MSSVRKRLLPSGEVRWQVDYKDGQGKRRSKQFRTKREADAYDTKVRGELATGVHVAASVSITVAQAGDLWLRRCERERLEASTMRQYRQHLNLHINPLLGDKKLSDLTKPIIERFRDDLLEDRSRPLARSIVTSLKGLLNEAQRLGHVGQNAAAFTEVKLSKRSRQKAEIPSKAEIGALLSKSVEMWPFTKVQKTRAGTPKVVAQPWAPFIVTAIFTGLRTSELRGLTWDHVDFATGVVRVRQRADFRNRLGDPKSEAGNRDVPLSPMALTTLRAWKMACPPTLLRLVFPTENGSIHGTENIHKQCWRPLLRVLGLVAVVEGREEPRYRLHDLRHAAASLFIEDGWMPKKVQAVLGHSSIQVTFDTYGHLFKSSEDDARAMARIEERLLRG